MNNEDCPICRSQMATETFEEWWDNHPPFTDDEWKNHEEEGFHLPTDEETTDE